jgi:hypothetical protein
MVGQPPPATSYHEYFPDQITDPSRPGVKKFLQYYMEELREQFRGNVKK